MLLVGNTRKQESNKARLTSFMGFHLQPKMKMQWNRWIRRIYMQRNSFADGWRNQEYKLFYGNSKPVEALTV
jgi:hypothetical protein